MNGRIICRIPHNYARKYVVTFNSLFHHQSLCLGSRFYRLPNSRFFHVKPCARASSVGHIIPCASLKRDELPLDNRKQFSAESSTSLKKGKFFQKKDQGTICKPYHYNRFNITGGKNMADPNLSCSVTAEFSGNNSNSTEKTCKEDNKEKLKATTESEGGEGSTIKEASKFDGHVRGHKRRGEKVVLRRMEVRRKMKSGVNNPDTVSLHVVGTGSLGNPRSVILHVDGDACYLFNCGEGTQRIISEKRMGLGKIDDVFITQKSWKNIGGLLGLVLSLKSFHIPKVNIHGPEGVEYPVTITRDFSEVEGFELAKVPASDTEFVDRNLRVTSVPLNPHVSTSTDDDEPSAKRMKMELEDSICHAFIVKVNSWKKRLNFEKCVELGLKKGDGPLWGKLQKGQDITMKDGRVIRAEEVINAPRRNSPILILEVPNAAYLEAVTTEPQFAVLQESEDENTQPELVVHMTPEHVLQSPRYQQWLKRFPAGTDHLILNEACNNVAHTGMYEIQAKLHLLHERIFPLLPVQLKQQKKTKGGCDSIDKQVSTEDGNTVDTTKGSTQEGEAEGGAIYGETGFKYSIRPHKSVKRDDSLLVKTDWAQKEVTDAPTFQELYSDFQEKLKVKEAEKPSPGNYPEIVFLGTASSIPGKYRNVSGILVRLSEDKSLLMDCGEGTFGQLQRHFGDDTKKILQGIEAVFLSHLHSDHHLGLYSVLTARAEALAEVGEEQRTSCLLLAPNAYPKFQHNFNSQLFPCDHLIDHVSVENLYEKNQPYYPVQHASVMEKLDLSEIRMVKVIHKQFPHAIVFMHKDGWKLVYSGDTKPCAQLITDGHDCDILIHEATMEDDLLHLAVQNKHSTTSQAIEVGVNMKAKFTMLTHFSQRYPQAPPINNNFHDRVGLAFDNMRVRICDLHLLPSFTPLLKEMFKEDYDLMEETRMKRSKPPKN